MKKIYLKTFGCQMNEYDSGRILDLLNQLAPTISITQPQEADIILLNTCSVREKAQEKVFSDLGRFKSLKKANPHLIIAVGGCVASQEGALILTRAPYVDIVFGPQTVHRLPDLIQKYRDTGTAQIDISFPEIEKFDHLPAPRVYGPTAFVSIMEGCSKYCSYCVVPYTRGEEVSRRFDDILTEISSLVQQGVREVTLLGQNVNAYSGLMVDGGKGSVGETADFALLLDYIAAFPQIERIRYMTSHPKEFTPRLIDAYQRIPKLANHLHLPVQHGSDRILMAMKRGYTVLEYKSIIRRLRAVRPDISISSDFIVGFPGETEEDFQKTLALIDEIGFDISFSFIFSPRPGTPAASLQNDIPEQEKSRRLHILQQRIENHVYKIQERMLGTCQPILIEGRSKKQVNELFGRADNNHVVNCETAWDQSTQLLGQMVNVKITQAYRHSLRGELMNRLR